MKGERITSWSFGPASLPDTFTKPSLWAEPGTLVSVGTNVSLWCRGPAGTKQYSMPRLEGSEYRTPSWPLTKVEFPISSVTKEDAGHYCCHYWSQSHRSPCSHPVELVVTGEGGPPAPDSALRPSLVSKLQDDFSEPPLPRGPYPTSPTSTFRIHSSSGNVVRNSPLTQGSSSLAGIYEKPTLLALPSPLVGSGEGVTLQCMAEFRFDRFALYKEGDDHSSSGYEWKSQANFSIPVVTRTHEGTYRCYSFSSDSPYHWSAPSDSVKVIVTGKVALTQHPSLL
ncbi:leukocyte immunoglobulin-like receptor subfamily A member 2 [Notamacropus eugenii]|uniref:leukocyte immunoglobulin-like receptor subfamily A member 2 n=1 Tax=Notamacropus eugenii TaxID=9315 RepID=UPI003B674E27